MNSQLPDTLRAIRACFARELRTSLLNRFVHVYSVAALLAGLAPLFADQTNDSAVPYFLLQALLYLVPLFALLVGTGSAQNDVEERPFLHTQPVRRGVFVAGKFLALTLVLSAAMLLLVLPGAIDGAPLGALAFLWACGAGTGAVFVALGLACGVTAGDRVKAHLVALCVWILFLAGFDFTALAAAHLPFVQLRPELWTALLMLNPLDAVRIGALFSIEKVPFDTAQAGPLLRWWLTHVGSWFLLLSTAWTMLALAWSARRLEHNPLQ